MKSYRTAWLRALARGLGGLFVMALLLVAPLAHAQQPVNCTTVLAEQDYYISGGGGTTGGIPASRVASSSAPQDWLTNAPAGGLPVGLVIADDFSTRSAQDLSHGEQVASHLTGLLDALGFSLIAQLGNVPSEVFGDAEVWERVRPDTTQMLYLVRVDTERFTTDIIRDRISAAVGWLRSQQPDDPAVSHTVVNMSFAVMPCNLFEGGDGTPDQNLLAALRNYRASVGQDAPLAALRDWLASQFDRLDNDPLYLYIAAETAESGEPTFRHSLFVASAGNIGDEFPFALYPGAWPEVVNVSATYAIHADEWWERSNPGEVSAPGAYFDDGNAVYAGTSFAAPAVSLYYALRMTALDTLPEACPFRANEPPYTAYMPVFTPTAPEEASDRDCRLDPFGQASSLLLAEAARIMPVSIGLPLIRQVTTALAFDLSGLLPNISVIPQVAFGMTSQQRTVDATFDVTGIIGYLPAQDEAGIPVYWGVLGEDVGLYRRDKTLMLTLP